MPTDNELFERAKQAGEVAQALFYTFVEHTWAYDMPSVRVTPGSSGELLTVEVVHASKTDSLEASVCKRVAGAWLFKFPRAAFRSADRNAKCALLADRHSVWAFVFMHVAVQVLFEDLVDNVERDVKEVVHYLPINAWRIVQHRASDRFLIADREDLPYPDEDGAGALKGVYRITLKNGAKIALDLAGAQYSPLHDTNMPWAAYCDRWVSDIKYRLPFRSHVNRHGEHLHYLEARTHLDVVVEQIACLNDLLRNCEYELGFDLKDLPSEELEYFRDCKYRLTTAAKDFLLRRPHDLDADLVAASKNDTEIPIDEGLECISGTIGNMQHFDWSALTKMIQMPGNKVTYREKKKAQLLRMFRCAYKLPRDWRLVFLQDSLPSARVPRECVSENPYYGKRK